MEVGRSLWELMDEVEDWWATAAVRAEHCALIGSLAFREEGDSVAAPFGPAAIKPPMDGDPKCISGWAKPGGLTASVFGRLFDVVDNHKAERRPGGDKFHSLLFFERTFEVESFGIGGRDVAIVFVDEFHRPVEGAGESGAVNNRPAERGMTVRLSS